METIVTTYANTVFDFDGLGTLDLRAPVGERERTLLAAAGLHGPFAVLSAWPAFGAQRDEARAALLTHRLRGLIGLHGVPAIPLLARSPDGAHREPSVAAAVDADTALAIARFFAQDALFWFDGQRFSIRWTAARLTTDLPLGH
ncbi:MAG: DUF3293 domain-containing protein [Planctomycetota bacterium]|nr:DUF3293 domain-containing protein [Planctomycetota bacterium]